ncbi:MAG: VWA domain-containing protein [Synergistaceae bacterium]|nr:VWA domain-containing protein [Synergistaceae bacterium]
MRVTTNFPALTAYKSLDQTNNQLQKTINALSTGLRINSASDDAAGFAISEKIRAQISGLDTALRNSQDGISFLQTAEGALGEANSMLQRMRELAVQASNDTLTSNDRQYIQLEIDELKDQINRIANTTQFNKKRILDGSSGAIWTSSDKNLKATINGGLTYTDQFGQKISAEGNYRIKVEADGGQAQVQKSSPMFIKHKNVIMDRAINTASGVNNVTVDDLPPGYYNVDGEPPNEAHAFVTGSYGIKLNELDESLKSKVRNSYLLSNASILFEVTEADDDKNGITVRATAQLLHTDGTNEVVTVDNISLKEGQQTDLSELLKVGTAGTDPNEADGAFELQLQNGATENFNVGDKFVYNLTVAEGVEDANRTVNIKNDNTVHESQEVYKTNDFKPKEHLTVPARVLFLIDDSGSMQTMIDTVRDNVIDFVDTIVKNGADDVKVGVASYSAWYDSSYNVNPHEVRKHTMNGADWSKDLDEIKNALNDITPSSGSEDHYKAIQDAISAYGISAGGDPTFIVLVTDTYQEMNNGVTKQDAINALNNADVSCSIIRPSSGYSAARSMSDLDELSDNTDGLKFDQTSATWGSDLSSELGQKIGQEALENALMSGLPLYQFEQFENIFPDSSAAEQTITITQDGVDKEITIGPNDTLKTLQEKISAATGGSTSVSFHDDNDDGEKMVTFTTQLDEDSHIQISGDRELLNAIGFRNNFETKFSLDSTAIMNKNVHMRQFYIDAKDGHVYNSDIILTTDDDHEIEEWGSYASFEAAYIGQIPKQDVHLRDLNKFWNSQGVFMLDSPQKITINQGNGKSTSITLYATDTVEDLRLKLNNAIANDLGQINYVNQNNFVSYVREGENTNAGDEAVEGTFIIRSAIPGKAGEISFSGDEDLLNALGLNAIQKSQETRYTASVFDAHSGIPVTNVKSTSPNFKNLIAPNVDIEVDPMAGLKASWDEATRRYIISHDETYSAVVHLKDASTVFQVGANEGEDFIVQLGDSSCDALGVSSVNVLTRENALRAISTLDSAITKLASQRAKIGAYQNALEHTMENLTTTSTNLTAAESRIRDADMSQMMMELVKLQILNQSGTSMLAQANQLPQSVLSLLQ